MISFDPSIKYIVNEVIINCYFVTTILFLESPGLIFYLFIFLKSNFIKYKL